MMNNVTLVGRITHELELKQTESGKSFCNLSIAIPRNFKNANGEYEPDFVDITLWESTAKNTVEYSKKGDMVGVKGRVQTRFIDNPDGTRKKKTEIIGEKVSFLASRDNPNKKKDDVVR